MTSILVALLLASNGSGKTLVRTNPGTTVPISGFSGPLIADDAGTVCHATFNGAAIQDTKGCAWVMAGTVPQVAKSGKTPAGAGPFSDANYYSLGTGSDALDLQNFTLCAVLTAPSGTYSAFYTYFENAAFPLGYTGDVNTAANFRGVVGAGAPVTGNAAAKGSLNVVCFGRDNGLNTVYVKTNLGTIASTTSSVTPATAAVATLGRSVANAGRGWTGYVHELWFTSTTPSDALFTAVMNRAKARAGVTAW